VTRTQTAALRELLEASEALHSPSGDLGAKGEWSRRYVRHERAAETVKRLFPWLCTVKEEVERG
jgi:hypothetical protein